MAWLPAARPQVSYENTSGGFEIEEEDIDHTVLARAYVRYRTRLAALKPRILETGKRHYSDCSYSRIKDYKLGDKEEKERLIIGVVRKYGPSQQSTTLHKLAHEERVLPRHYATDVIWPPQDRRQYSAPKRDFEFPEELYEEWDKINGVPPVNSQKDIFDLSDEPERKKMPKTRPAWPKKREWIELEDEDGCIRLMGDCQSEQLCEGMVVGIVGRFKTITDWDTFSWEIDVDRPWFDVSRVIGPGSRQVPWPEEANRPKGAYLAIISGLNLSGVPGLEKNTILAFTQFVNWLKEELPYQSESDRDLAKKVVRVLIAGDNLRHVPELDCWAGIVKLKKVFDDGTMPMERGVETLDRLLMDLTFLVPVDLMPGNPDCGLPQWPQQELDEAIFHLARIWGANFQTCTNPYSFQLGGLDFLVTNGQNVTDILKKSPGQNSLDVMDRLLQYQHLAPTCPSSIEGYPIDQRDPLVLETLPHVFIAGSQSEVNGRYFYWGEANTMCLSLPKFSETLTVTFFDLETHMVSFRHFGISLDRVQPILPENRPRDETPRVVVDLDDSFRRPESPRLNLEKSDEEDCD